MGTQDTQGFWVLEAPTLPLFRKFRVFYIARLRHPTVVVLVIVVVLVYKSLLLYTIPKFAGILIYSLIIIIDLHQGTSVLSFSDVHLKQGNP